MGKRISIPVVVALLALLAPSAAGARDSTIQPGDWASVMVTPEGSVCTLGWAFDGSDGNVYFGSAAHCGGVGHDVMISDPSAAVAEPTEPLGEVALAGAEGPDPSVDVSLIRVRDEIAHRVQGELRGHPGIPTGVTMVADAAPGDTLGISGWGTGFEASAPTRQSREGVFLEGDAFSWSGLIPTTGGDSGGPIAHLPSKGAFGINKGGRCTTASTFACAMFGGSIAALQRLAATKGLALTLRVAGGKRPAPGQPQPQPQPQPPASDPPPATAEQPPRQEPATTLRIVARKLSARRIAKRKSFHVTLTTSRRLTHVSVLLTRAKKTVAVGTVRGLAGQSTVKVKPRRAVRAGRYRLVATGMDDLGRTVQARATAKVAR